VEKILSERRLGSTSLAKLVLEAYKCLAEESVNLKHDVEILSQHIREARPAMPLIKRFNEEVMKRLIEYDKSRLLNACNDVENTYQSILRKLVENALNELSSYRSVVTLSHSGTILEILKNCEKIKKVYILESRPLREGLLTASELCKMKEVIVCVDAAAVYAVEACEAVVVGADALFRDGSFSGKIGVRALAMAAKEYGKPFYVACDSWKKGDIFINEYGLKVDVSEQNCFDVLNPIFETVPNKFVTAFLTDKGVIKPTDVKLMF